MIQNNYNETEKNTETDLNNFIKSLEDKELIELFNNQKINLNEDNVKKTIKSNHEDIIEKKIENNTCNLNNEKVAFNLHGKTLLESKLEPFLYKDVPYNILFENMVRELSEIYLKYVLFFLILLFIVLIFL